MVVDEKLKPILAAINGVVDSKELNAAVTADNFEGEFELSEDGLKALDEAIKGLLSLEAAKSSPEVIDHVTEKVKEEVKDATAREIKAKQLFAGEKGYQAVADKLGIELSVKPGDPDALFKMAEELQKADLNIQGDETLRETLAEKRKENEALNNSILELKENHKLELEQKDIDFAKKETKNTFLRKTYGYKWAETVDDTLRGALLDKVYDELNAEVTLKVEDGKIVPYQKDKPDERIFVNNKKQEFDDLLKPKIDPYLKKSDGKTPPPKPRKEIVVVDEDTQDIAEYRDRIEKMHTAKA